MGLFYVVYYMKNKLKINHSEMITHMKDKGIKFEIVGEEDAKEFLKKENNYFRVTAYRNNFPKINGKYLDLDFAYLQDMVEIDFLIRELLLNMTLHLEQSIKSKLINFVTIDTREDGFEVVTDFGKGDKLGFEQTIKYLRSNKYAVGLKNRYQYRLPIWVFLEIVPFGTLCRFTSFYYKRSKFKSFKEISELLVYCKNIRNASAHNNCIIINLFKSIEKIDNVSQQVKQINSEIFRLNYSVISDRKIHDIMCLFYMCSKYLGSTENLILRNQCKIFLKRCQKNKKYYRDCIILNKCYGIFEQMIDVSFKIL